MSGSGALEGGNLRASDGDRNRVADELRVHCLEGRISVDELDKRVGQAMSAETIHELAVVVVDLPTIRPAEDRPVQRDRMRVGPPGIRPFTRHLIVPAPIHRTRVIALDTIAPGLNGYGYELKLQSPTSLEFERSSRPSGSGLAAILLFPFGLLGLLARNKERIVISFEPHSSNDTSMIVHGRAVRKVRKAFAQLAFS